MTDVFISYASEDRERARKLASALEAQGWSVWWDRKIIAGQSFDQVIEHELETAKSVVVLWSKNSISSEWVKNEAAVAAERGVLVPALIDSVKLPLEFRRKQVADMIGWDGDLSHGGFQALCDGVAATANITGMVPRRSTIAPRGEFRWNRRWTLGAITAFAVALGFGAYWGLVIAPRQVEIQQFSVARELATPSAQIKHLRSVAAAFSSDTVNAMLVKHGFYDRIRNASGKGIAHQYVDDAEVVIDHATGLMWQKAGSNTINLADATNYINRLNAEKFAGFSDWRLPTLDEAMSLMEPQAYDQFHIDPVFERGVNFIWTADRTPDGHGWVVYFYDGILAAEKAKFNAWTRAVRRF
jgi:TIR domain/Protein of unknown function (DUF1566)